MTDTASTANFPIPAPPRHPGETVARFEAYLDEGWSGIGRNGDMFVKLSVPDDNELFARRLRGYKGMLVRVEVCLPPEMTDEEAAELLLAGVEDEDE